MPSDDYDVSDAVAREPRRRDFFRYSGGVAAAGAIAGSGLLASAPAQAGTAQAGADAAATPSSAAANGNLLATPIRPPAAPLAVRSPYVSTWLPATALPGTWQEFWQGHTTAMGGIARIDGASYMFMGDPSIVLTVPNGNQGTPSTVQGFEQALQQTALEVTPARSRFTLEGGAVQVTVEFFSPVEPGDLKRQSIPLSYVLISARSSPAGRTCSASATPTGPPRSAGPTAWTPASPRTRRRPAGRPTPGCAPSRCARPTAGRSWWRAPRASRGRS